MNNVYKKEIILECINAIRDRVYHEAQDTDFDIGYEKFRSDAIAELTKLLDSK